MRWFAAPLVLLGLAAACSSTSQEGSEIAPPTGPLHAAFATSAAQANVPRDLLVAIAKVEDGLGIPAERLDLDVDNDVPAAGPLQLRRGKLDTLRRGAELAGTTELELRQHSDRALGAGALVLAELGKQTGATGSDLPSWSRALAELSGFADDAHRERYVHDVYAVLARGGSFAGREGETITLAPHEIPPSLTVNLESQVKALAGAQYAGAEWIPTSCANTKCNLSRSGARVEYVVVHDTEGNWNASVATLQNDPGKSVQYIIGTDGRLAQFVTEETTAFHAGNIYFNQRSIGIEHVGYATQPFTESQYRVSAKLVDHLLSKYAVPRDRAHVIGHDQIPNSTRISISSPPCSDSPKGCQANLSYGGANHHTDPGIWEWATYMPRFNGQAKCNDATSLLNCSNDRTKAFRCVNGRVEVRTCKSACLVRATGTDDACEAATTTTPDGGTRPSDSDGGDLEPDSSSDDGNDGDDGATERMPRASDEPEGFLSSGCTQAPAGPSMLGVVALGLVLGAVRRRRATSR